MSTKMILATIAAIVALGTITTNGFINSALGQQTFSADLSGDDELPPVDTNATGIIMGSITPNSINYQLSVTDLDNPRAAHIHMGDEDHNGKVVAWLYNSTSAKGPTTGLLSQGNVTASDLVGPLKGQPLSALIDLMGNGTTYVNVHTKDFPLGEIRGQVSTEGEAEGGEEGG
jgi:hypothetical protein